MKGILRIFIFFLSFIVITVIAGYTTYLLLTSAKSIEVPQLRGKSLLEANEVLGRMKLSRKVLSYTLPPRLVMKMASDVAPPSAS